MQNYQERNLYVQNFIRSRNYDFSPEYSELIGRLCAVEGAMTMRESSVGVASELMATFRGSGLYDTIDRVCLALRVGESNELAVIDSSNSERAGPNRMQPFYRCFVRANSSLFSLREGEIRIYDDASIIAEAFTKHHKPIQRSLSYILQMGFNSGACLPLFISRSLRGYLFLNATQLGLFSQLADEDYAILNIIGMIAKLALASDHRVDPTYERLAATEGIGRFMSALFDEEEFREHLNEIAQWSIGTTWRPRIECDGDCNFLYSPTNLAFSVVRICELFHGSPSAFPDVISIVNRVDGHILIRIPVSDDLITPTLDKYRERVRTFERNFSFLRLSLTPSINHIDIVFPFDPITRTRDDILYSV